MDLNFNCFTSSDPYLDYRDPHLVAGNKACCWDVRNLTTRTCGYLTPWYIGDNIVYKHNSPSFDLIWEWPSLCGPFPFSTVYGSFVVLTTQAKWFCLQYSPIEGSCFERWQYPKNWRYFPKKHSGPREPQNPAVLESRRSTLDKPWTIELEALRTMGENYRNSQSDHTIVTIEPWTQWE